MQMLANTLSQDDQAARAAFTNGMRHLLGAVSVVTASVGPERNGLTATSVTSLSADPPSLIVCVKQSASGLPLIRRAQRFGVNVLGHSHRAVADRFAGRFGHKGEDRFAEGDWLWRSGQAPLLKDALVSFACELEEVIERFSHAILVGRVVETSASFHDHALTYWRGDYGRMSDQ